MARCKSMDGCWSGEDEMMGDSGDFYNIGHDSLSLGIDQMGRWKNPLTYVQRSHSKRVDKEMRKRHQAALQAAKRKRGIAGPDFGVEPMHMGEDEGMMGGLTDTLKSPMGMAAVAVAAFLIWKKMKK